MSLAYLDTHSGIAGDMLLAEANQWPEDAVAYFGAGDECHCAFHFPVMPRMFMAVQMEDRRGCAAIAQRQHHGAAAPDLERRCGGGESFRPGPVRWRSGG